MDHAAAVHVHVGRGVLRRLESDTVAPVARLDDFFCEPVAAACGSSFDPYLFMAVAACPTPAPAPALAPAARARFCCGCAEVEGEVVDDAESPLCCGPSPIGW